ncbi:fungal-specific transcription factor domain-containing protein [Trametes polyzona]|nr:fungal-specific transcription factor domain-containing protein [Trametes polyzona]
MQWQWCVPAPPVSTPRPDPFEVGSRSKLRKVERACDHCRKRKSKCDGPQRSDNICSSCEANSRQCTYLEDSKPRGPSKSYILALEDRIHKTDMLLRRLRPELDLDAELGPSPNRLKMRGNTRASTSHSNAGTSSSLIRATPSNGIPLPILPLLPPLDNAYPLPFPRPSQGSTKARRKKRRRGGDNASDSAEQQQAYYSTAWESSDSDDVDAAFTEGMRLTSRGLESSAVNTPNHHLLRFQGKSSSLTLFSTTMDIIQRELAAMRISGNEATGDSATQAPQLPPMPERPGLPGYQLLPWEIRLKRAYDPTVLPDTLHAAFPPDDLAEELIRLFFLHEHITFPLLHRPTFERQWRDKLHLRSVWFACVCMSVFGLASRWTTDPRVLSGGTDTPSEGSGPALALTSLPGWRYISVTIKITELQSGLLIPPELCEIQTLVLLSQYLRGTVAADTAWFWISAGVMKTQDMGLHRRKTYGRTPTVLVEDELWKRAYWHVVTLDRFGSVFLGKPYYAREEDLDLDLPLEVDDEYWEATGITDREGDGSPNPSGDIPSLTTGFVCWIKLSQIAVAILRTLYSPKKAKRMFTSSETPWTEAVVDQLNNMLLRWIDELPPHLRWRPDMEDTPFASQAATLLATYHTLQALVQRPFLALRQLRTHSTSIALSATSQKALSISLNAVRASARIAEVQLGRGSGDVVTFLHVLFSAVGILLVQLWDLVRLWDTRHADADAAEGTEIGARISELLTEVSEHIERMQELAPRWELARHML